MRVRFVEIYYLCGELKITTMDEYDDLSVYNGDTYHDMEVDYDYDVNTGELSEWFDEDEQPG